MVKSGNFLLELVAADSKEPFKEHAERPPGRRVFAEVEPNTDYFVRIKSEHSGRVKVEIFVDGVSLGHTTRLKCRGGSYQGIYEVNDGIPTTTALSFSPMKLMSKIGSITKTTQIMCNGTVRAHFYAVKKTNRVKKRNLNITSSLSRGQAIAGENAVSPEVDNSKTAKEKVVCSVRGNTVLSKGILEEYTKVYETGDLLDTITLHYCTAPALVANELLNPPPYDFPDDNSELSNAAAKSEATKKRKMPEVQKGGKSKKNAIKKDVNFNSIGSDGGEIIVDDDDDDAATVKVEEVTVLTEVCTIDLTGDYDVDDVKVTTSFRESQSC